MWTNYDKPYNKSKAAPGTKEKDQGFMPNSVKESNGGEVFLDTYIRGWISGRERDHAL